MRRDIAAEPEHDRTHDTKMPECLNNIVNVSDKYDSEFSACTLQETEEQYVSRIEQLLTDQSQ